MRMKKVFLIVVSALIVTFANAQTIKQRLDKAVHMLLHDEQMTHAIMSLYVVETKTGNIVYSLNEDIGLPAASTQKIIISGAVLDLLGKDYTYKTYLGYSGSIINNKLNGNLYISGYADPTFGSWRYAQTKRDSILNKIIAALNKKGIEEITGNIVFDESKFSYQPLPGGWPWEDIGNYYGAGSWAINWNENQYDLLLKPGKHEGDTVEITGSEPQVSYKIINFLKTGSKGSGDNSIIYMPPYSNNAFLEGTVPAGEDTFTVSGSIAHPAMQFANELNNTFSTHNIQFNEIKVLTQQNKPYQDLGDSLILIDSFFSPKMDSIIYWFLQKSINLYGEALTKTIAYQNEGFGSKERGLALIKQFWQQQGIDSLAINIIDGSGLSPQNRITAKSLVQVLQYAKAQPWFKIFYSALPTFNDMKMKSGTIGGTKAFTGYHTAKSGTEYSFAIIINNYQKGSIVPKMYKVLDELK